MILTAITVSYGETQSLPEYSNVKPNITLSAALDDTDNPAEAEALLWQHAKESVHAQIDAALEANGCAAKYDPCPRFQVMRTYNNTYRSAPDELDIPIVVVVFPNDMELSKERFGTRFVHAAYSESRKIRYEHAMRVAAEFARMYNGQVLDCADGDLSRLEVALRVSVPEYAPDGENPF